jgi:hypothetical protein
MAIEETAALDTVTFAVAVLPPRLAVMTAVPVPTACTKPFDTVAIFLAELDQVASLVAVELSPLPYWAVSENCFEAPRGRALDVGDIVNV